MKRQLTGWIAWGALAAIIAVPSVEIVFSDPAPAEAQVASVEETVEREPFFGPMPKRPVQGPNPFEAPPAPVVEQVSPVASVEMPQTAEVAEDPSGPVEQTPHTPLTPRIVGDERMVTASRTPEASTSDAALRPVDGLPEASVATTRKPVVTSRPPLSPSLDKAETPVLETAAADPEINISAPAVTSRAPVPMPASMRPSEPELRSVAAVSFEDEVKQSIDNIRGVRRNSEIVVDYSEDFVDEDTLFWGDDPRYRRGEPLVPFDDGEFYEEDYASGEGFADFREDRRRPPGFRSRGSFEEQLPARRGGGVRMDLLQ